METGLQSGLITAVLVAIPVLIGFFVYITRPTLLAATAELKARVGTTKWNQLEQYGRLAVQAVAQTMGLESNEAKKAYVVQFLQEQAIALDVPITEKELDTLIEAIVYEVKNQWHSISGLELELPEIVEGARMGIDKAAIEPA